MENPQKASRVSTLLDKLFFLLSGSKLWNFLKSEQFRTCLNFFLSKVIFIFADVFTDIVTSVSHFQGGNIKWGLLTLLVIFIPTGFTLVIDLFKLMDAKRGWYELGHKLFERCVTRTCPDVQTSDNTYQRNKEYSTARGLKHLPFVQVICNLRIFIALATMDTTNPFNTPLKDSLMTEAMDVSAKEAFLESTPQIILQLYIISSTGDINILQVIGLVISFFSLSNTSAMLFFSERIGEEKEIRPTNLFEVLIAPLVFLDLLGSLVLILLACTFSKGRAFLGVIAIIILNAIMAKIWHFSKDLKAELNKKSKYENSCQIQDLIQGIPKTIQLGYLTSWIINTVIVKSTVKFQPVSLATSVIVYLVCHLVALYRELSLERSALSDYSILFCAPKLQASEGNITSILMNTIPALKFNESIVRLCGESELPSDVTWNYLVPGLGAILILKCISGIILFLLSDYKKLVRFAKLFGINYFHYIEVIEDPTKTDLKKLIKWLLKNPALINKQDPITGQTILHKLSMHPDVVLADFHNLYEKGGSHEIKDFGGVPASSHWDIVPETLDCNQSKASNKLIQLTHDFTKFPIWVSLGAQPTSVDGLGESASKKLAIEFGEGKTSILGLSKILKNLSHLDVMEIMAIMIDHLKNTIENQNEDEIQNQNEDEIQNQNGTQNQNEDENQNQNGSQNLNEDENQNQDQNRNEDESQNQNEIQNPNQDEIHTQNEIEDANPNQSTHEDENGSGREQGDHSILQLIPAVVEDEPPVNKRILQLISEVVEDQINLTKSNWILSKLKSLKMRQNYTLAYWNNPLQFAIEIGNEDILVKLLSLYPWPNIKNIHGQTPIHTACRWGKEGCLRILLENNGNPNARDGNGKTALHVAAQSGHPNCATVLLDFKVDLNAQDNNGFTALHLATLVNSIGCVKLLLDNHAVANLEKRKNFS